MFSTKLTSRRQEPLWAIFISIIVASVLVVYPLQYPLGQWRPLYMLLLMLFWVVCQPTWCGVWFAFSVGLFVDALVGAPLGLNGVLFVLICYVTRFFIRDQQRISFWQLWLIMALGLLSYWLTHSAMLWMLGLPVDWQRQSYPILSSLIIFPLLYRVLKRWHVSF